MSARSPGAGMEQVIDLVDSDEETSPAAKRVRQEISLLVPEIVGPGEVVPSGPQASSGLRIDGINTLANSHAPDSDLKNKIVELDDEPEIISVSAPTHTSSRKLERRRRREERASMFREQLEQMSSENDRTLATRLWQLLDKEKERALDERKRFAQLLQNSSSDEEAADYRHILDNLLHVADFATQQIDILINGRYRASNLTLEQFQQHSLDRIQHRISGLLQSDQESRVRRYDNQSTRHLQVSEPAVSPAHRQVGRVVPPPPLVPSSLHFELENGGGASSQLNSPYNSFDATVRQSHFAGAEEAVDMLIDEIHKDIEPMDMPAELNVTSLEYQRLGLGWLVKSEQGKNQGSILADDMGLGKTVQTIALIFANKPPADDHQGLMAMRSQRPRQTLIVCPLSLVSTWKRELSTRVQPEHRPRVYVHNRNMSKGLLLSGSAIERTSDIVITTFDTMMYEHKAMSRQNGKPFPLFEVNWWRVVLDEAHVIKNYKTQTSIAASNLQAAKRLCLTGTPMQNRLEELWSLLRFLRIQPYCDDRAKFSAIIPGDNFDPQYNNEQMQRFQAFLATILLRRKKDTRINGRAILADLPHKTIEDIFVDLPQEEKDDYANIEKGIQKKARKLLHSLQHSNMTGILTLLLRMRQASCHRQLPLSSANRDILIPPPADDNIIDRARLLPQEIVFRAMGTLPGSLACPRCGEVLSNSVMVMFLVPCGHHVCRECEPEINPKNAFGTGDCPECNMNVLDAVHSAPAILAAKHPNWSNRQVAESVKSDRRSAMESLRKERWRRKERLAELIRRADLDSMWAGGLGSDSESDLDEFFGEEIGLKSSRSRDDNENSSEGNSELNFSGSESPTASILEPTTWSSTSGLLDQEHRHAPTPSPRVQLGPADEMGEGFKSVTGNDKHSRHDFSQASDPWWAASSAIQPELGADQKSAKLGVVNESSKNEPTSRSDQSFQVNSADLKHEAETTVPAHARSPRNTFSIDHRSNATDMYKLDIDEVAKLYHIPKMFVDGWIPAAKVDAFMKTLNGIWSTAPTDKVIVFSVFTSMLDILTIPLDAARIDYLMYTGELSGEERSKVLDQFSSTATKVLLMSLRAGNVGLTLTEANRVILVEPFWNPYVEEQAMNRVHRIGQTKPVTIYRLLNRSTIEERILVLQEKKKQIVESALSAQGREAVTRLGREELAYLLGVGR